MGNETPTRAVKITAGIASLTAARQIERCLRALEAQEDAPEFDVVVAHNPALEGVAGLREKFPAVRFVGRVGWWAPIQLMALAASEARGEIFMMTEDHCVPEPDWVRRLCDALQTGRAAAGGPIDTRRDATAAAWAFYFLDFFRYLSPVVEGVTPAISVCNVAYRRADLEAIRECWETGFHETEVHWRLCAKHGPLWMEPKARIIMLRNVGFGGAMGECYGQGRLFAAKRVEFADTKKRIFYLLLAPLLPVLLLIRRAQKGLSDAPGQFLKSLPALMAMVLAWSWGEGMGYLTRRPPQKLALAEDIEAQEIE